MLERKAKKINGLDGRAGVWRNLLGLFLVGLVLLPCVPFPAQAQAPPAGTGLPATVLRVEVEGNQRVARETILQWFAVRPGDTYEPRRVAAALQDLTRKGRFADVVVEGELEAAGVVLYLRVEEFPYLAGVRFEGNKEMKEADLRAQTLLAPGSFLSPWQLGRDRDKLLQLYRDKGYHSASLADTLLVAEKGEFTLLWRVAEGKKASIQEIVFVGNAAIPAPKLRKQMKTNTGGLLSDGDLKPDVLREDFEKITQFYGSQGYLDARVTHHESELGANGKDLTLRIYVEEGKQYRVGKVEWQGNTVFTDAQIGRQVRLFRGAPFDRSALEATTAALYELYQDMGYFYFVTSPAQDIRGEVVNVGYELKEGVRARLNHVRVVGNTKTHDKVVLRELALLPGDTFDRSLLQRSMRDIFQLGFFEDVNIPPDGVRPQDDGNVDVELRVVEKQTGQLGAGAGYSAVNAVTGFLEMAETNLFGTGKRVSFRWEFSKYRNDVNFSYTQPWLLDSPTTLTVDLFNTGGRTRVNSFYRVQRTGIGLRVGRRLHALDYTTIAWRYRAENVRFTDVSAQVSESVRSSLEDGRRRSIGVTLRRNSTDSPFFPTRGTEAEWSADVFGGFLGGTESYVRNEVDLAWYQRLGVSKFTLALRSRVAVLSGLEGHDVPNDELFRPGGVFVYSVRGYDEFEIVPVGNELFVGGQALSLFSSELRYPFSPSVHGALFFDAGNTWNTLSGADPTDLRKGAGLGIRIQVPMIGLLGLDYAYGFDRVNSLGQRNPSWNFHFRFGNFF